MPYLNKGTAPEALDECEYSRCNLFFLWDFVPLFLVEDFSNRRLSGRSRTLTEPVEAPPLSSHEARKVPLFGAFGDPAQDGGGFHQRSQRLTEPKKVCWLSYM